MKETMINGNFEILAKYNSIYLNFLKTNESSFSLAERNPLQIYHYSVSFPYSSLSKTNSNGMYG